MKFELIFKGPRDGDSVAKFHEKVNGKEHTITLVETTKNHKFGGYISVEMESKAANKVDPDAFIFNLDEGKKSKYYNKTYVGKKAINTNPQCFPTFGGGGDLSDIYISNQIFIMIIVLLIVPILIIHSTD